MTVAAPSQEPSNVPPIVISMTASNRRQLLADVRLRQPGQSVTDRQVFEAAARTYADLCLYHLAGHQIELVAEWNPDIETTRQQRAELQLDLHWNQQGAKRFSEQDWQEASTYAVQLDGGLVRRLEAMQERGGYPSIGLVLAEAAVAYRHVCLFHHKHRDHTCWVSIDGCGRRRWYWPWPLADRPGRKIGSLAGMELGKFLSPKR